MDRRRFLKNGGLVAASWAAMHEFEPWRLSGKLLAAENARGEENINWADPQLGATAKASSYVENPAGPPGNFSLGKSVLGETLELGWETETETVGAWLDITFPDMAAVRELWILAKPIPYDIVLDPYRRGEVTSAPRKITYAFAAGPSFQAELRQGRYFQILTLPQQVKSKSLRIKVDETWNDPGTQGTGLGKVRVYSRLHEPAFSITVYHQYDVHEGRPVQSATIEIINPANDITDAHLQISQGGTVLMTVPLGPIPSRAVAKQDTWIPAPFEDAVMEFKILSQGSLHKVSQSLRVPACHSYFDGGTFNLLCTNHNDLGWLDTQAKTAAFEINASTRVGVADANGIVKGSKEYGHVPIDHRMTEYDHMMYQDETVQSASTYYYRVCAVDNAGQRGECSAVASVRTK